RNKRRHVDKVSRSRLGSKFEPFAPAHACLAAHYVDDTLHRSMMMRTRLGIGMNSHCAGPNLLCTDARKIDRCRAFHTRRLRGIGIELIGMHDTYAAQSP